MSIEIMTLVWKSAPYSGNKLITLLALADWSNDEGVCWPSISTLATKCRQSKRNVIYCLQQFSEDGFVSVKYRKDTSSLYKINVRKLHQCKNCTPPLQQYNDDNDLQQSDMENHVVEIPVENAQIAPYTSVDTSIETKPFSLSSEASVSIKSTKKAKIPDPRHQPFKKLLEAIWVHMNPELPPANWDAGDAGQLGRFLTRWKTLDMETFKCWLQGYYESKNTNRAHRPKQFLPRLHDFAYGPRGKYNELEENRATV